MIHVTPQLLPTMLVITLVMSPEWALHRENRTRDVRFALYRRVTLAAIDSNGDPQTT